MPETLVVPHERPGRVSGQLTFTAKLRKVNVAGAPLVEQISTP
jgi:hypothetical protein